SFSPEKVDLSVEENTQGVELELTLPAQIEAQDYDFTVLATSSSGGQTKILSLTLKVEAGEAVSVEKVEIAATASDLPADGKSSTQLTISLKGAANQAVSGQTVTLTVDSGQVSTVTDNGDGSYTATYTAGSKAGTATVTAKTTNSKTATVQLTLTAKETEAKTTPSFTLSSLKSGQEGQAGGTLSDLVKLQAKDGFSGKVTLFATDLPDGVKVVFDPKEVTLTAEEPLQTPQMLITLEADLKEGDYQAVVLATSET
ncbi:MAG: Ig-like domain-containing protein, partial [Candidatus Poribacteria bacterium]|nr:Ig-like domain-containing protein [Candidatus Poribacteria bacterium]